jgi:hypothetical protein
MTEENYWQDNNIPVQNQEFVTEQQPGRKHSGLAIGGLCQRNRHKIFLVLGLIFNIVFLLGIAGLIVIGLLAA